MPTFELMLIETKPTASGVKHSAPEVARQKTVHVDKPVILGRLSAADRGVWTPMMTVDIARIPIVAATENSIAEEHVRLDPLDNGLIRIVNLHPTRPIQVRNQHPVLAQQTGEYKSPIQLRFGSNLIIGVELREPDDSGLQSLPRATAPPMTKIESFSRFLFPEDRRTIAAADMIACLRQILTLFERAANSDDFFRHATEAALDMLDLDRVQLLELKEGKWNTRSQAMREWDVSSESSTIPPVSQRVIHEVMKTQFTYRHKQSSRPESGSLKHVVCAVASPVLDRKGTVIGILYGDRFVPRGASDISITELEAMLLELLASGVAGGLARLEQERLEQFFTPQIAAEVARNPRLLESKNVPISILFCDIQSFSRITKDINDDARTLDWIFDTLTVLSRCVHEEQGVLVDYIGDALMAMWGAPDSQLNHAERACRSAMRMLNCLPALNQKWEPILKAPIKISVGINSGNAQVGNIGSSYKFKYGPMGDAVNMASRIQSATKFLKTWILVSESTHQLLPNNFKRRRLACLEVVNIPQPIDVYELISSNDAKCEEICSTYDSAYNHFLNQNWDEAARILGNWRSKNPEDLPSLVLLSRVVQAIVDRKQFQPVWKLDQK